MNRYPIQSLVETLLLEHGEYVPLALLLHEGRLDYRDYEAWRRGERDILDAVVFGDPAQIRQQLADAEAYLQRRGWHAVTLEYSVWNAVQAQRLRFSRDPQFDACFHRGYRKPQDQPQLDLFTDDPATAVVNALARALGERDVAEARHQLGRLADLAPDHLHLGGFERLTEAAGALQTAAADPPAELHSLQSTIAPLATDLLGAASRNLLVPLWRRLAQALDGQPFDPDTPDLHASYCTAQALDWHGARDAIEREHAWQAQPILLQRHAVACERQHDDIGALQVRTPSGSMVRLCWQFPAKAAGALESSGSGELHAGWEGFEDLDPLLSADRFPAWLLLHRPALSRVLPDPADADGSVPDSYLTAYRLARLRSTPANGPTDEIALRSRLQQQDALLLRHFLRTLRGDSPSKK